MADKTTTYIVIGLIGLGLLLLLRRQRAVPNPELSAEYTPLRLRPASQPELGNEKQALVDAGGHRYLNKEIRDIEWSSDGLPVRITITRDAVQT